MNCPECTAEIPVRTLTVEDNEGDVEVGFTCPTCLGEHFCLLTSGTFIPVN